MAERDRALGARGGVDFKGDRHLVERCQDGDGSAFAELFSRYHDRLYHFCLRRLTDASEAEDVTQEAFLRAWRALPSLAGERRFYPWLTVIAGNLCTDALRQRVRSAAPNRILDDLGSDRSRPERAPAGPSPEESVMATFDAQLASRALGRLSPRHRWVLWLREEAGLSYAEIAHAEGVRTTTIETLLWRARQALKREYSALANTKVFGGLLVIGAMGRDAMRWATRRMALLRVFPASGRARELLALTLTSGALTSAAVVQTPYTPSPPSPVLSSPAPAITDGNGGSTPSSGRQAPDVEMPATGPLDSAPPLPGPAVASTAVTPTGVVSVAVTPAGAAMTGTAPLGLPPLTNTAVAPTTTQLLRPPQTLPSPVTVEGAGIGTGIGAGIGISSPSGWGPSSLLSVISAFQWTGHGLP